MDEAVGHAAFLARPPRRGDGPAGPGGHAPATPPLAETAGSAYLRRHAAGSAAMNWFTGFVVYFLVWWTVLFAVLPIGVQPDSEGDTATGGWRGAPQAPGLLKKALLTTLISAVIWAGLAWVINSPWLSFREGWLAMPTN
ncbi:DUF1467 family protein [Teichococcus aestuarii]|nr:DUF1467 family protein [Pseudoroseomonas aestuarii]